MTFEERRIQLARAFEKGVERPLPGDESHLDELQRERRRLLFAPIPTASLGATVHGGKTAGGCMTSCRAPVYHPNTHRLVGWMSTGAREAW